MKRNIVIAALMLTSLSCAADHTSHWGYEGQEKPENWGKLSPEFSTCENGKNQSPINIDNVLKTQHENLTFSFEKGKQEIVNNGHTIQVNVTGNNQLILDEQIFTLQQFHFHTPSENTIKGKHYPMEAHFVYKNKDGELTVVALMFNNGEANPEIAKAWQQMPAEVNNKIILDKTVDINTLFPKKLDYYRFSGSLTTPPCTEGVRWIVLEQAVTASDEQIQKFHSTMHHDNNRPVQPLNGRVIVD
ncbi:carbonic anhydrase family protein [Gilliamella sp. B14448G11]|uniref:carbonic anhydrase n=1 Tax=unclassified Gilliamella TaxID=2685620 RepID=UPI0018DD6431|nr:MULTISPECIES: carbonic anhydrase family protein [unclassified Gilliamella]MBI0028910.1 carbonic anhydrase family protein [Gilliamella sp. B14448G7]MBI0030385.1 carbonic anhydrase family protein [Gilliamella sp. B14384G15]MBI0036031.1 carbonic anhydrase family protein [Gilliamella sp. B14448G11]MBI0043028.1 carbonic anhydrase family protein [Gilliamella sp. B14448G12]MBI0056983.1 carbonic anhydrase family protein [Gilliamella sp. B14384G12]